MFEHFILLHFMLDAKKNKSAEVSYWAFGGGRERACLIMYNLKVGNWIWTKLAVQFRMINKIQDKIKMNSQ